MRLFSPRKVTRLIIQFYHINSYGLPSHHHVRCKLSTAIGCIHHMSEQLPRRVYEPIIRQAIKMRQSIPMFKIQRGRMQIVFLLHRVTRPLLTCLWFGSIIRQIGYIISQLRVYRKSGKIYIRHRLSVSIAHVQCSIYSLSRINSLRQIRFHRQAVGVNTIHTFQ